MKPLIVLIFSLFQFALFGQSDSIKQQILNYKNTETEFINNARALLRDRIEAENLIGLKEIHEQLRLAESDKHIALFPLENLLLSFINQDYAIALESLKNWSSNQGYYERARIYPQKDLLKETLWTYLAVNSLDLQVGIRTSNLNYEEKDFLLLCLDFLLKDSETIGSNQLHFNEKSDQFLAKYPNSTYQYFVKQHIRYRYELTNWGWGMDFVVGHGRSTRDIPNFFKNNFVFGMGFDLTYKNLVLYLRGTIGISSTLQDIFFEGEKWEIGSQANITIPEASIGYNFVYKNLRITPFAGIAGTLITPVEVDMQKQPVLRDAYINSFAYTYGGNIDFCFDQRFNPFTNGENWVLRLRYNYVINNFEENYLDINGNGHTFTIGVGGYIRNKIRKL